MAASKLYKEIVQDNINNKYNQDKRTKTLQVITVYISLDKCTFADKY